MKNLIRTIIILLLTLAPAAALAGNSWYDYGYTTFDRPVVVDPYTGPYDGGFEWTVDGNNNMMNRLFDRIWYQVQAPWPYEYEPLSYYQPQMYAPQPIQSQPWYGGWRWSDWFGWSW